MKSSSPHYEIFEAVSGAAGLELCKSHPDISEFEVLLKLVPVARHPDMALVVLTQVSSRDVLNLAKKRWPPWNA